MARATTNVTLTNGEFTQIAVTGDDYVIQNIGGQAIKVKFAASQPATDSGGMTLYPMDMVNATLLGDGDLWAEPVGSGDGLVAKTIG